jgi:UDP-glucose 4-epimerase
MRYLVTGGSGYIGSRLVNRLSQRNETERIVIADVKSPGPYLPKTGFVQLDVRDRDGVRRAIEEAEPDALVHLAFILNPIHDEALMYDVDVNGTHNVLEAASAAGVQHALVVSSTTAYGAFSDNPVPLTEEHPVRGAPDFSYAQHKTESDRVCQLWALQHPDRKMTIVRPCIVFGPNVNNYIVRFWTRQPFQADFGNLDAPMQFVHEDDVVSALSGLLDGGHEGIYNVTGDGYITLREAAEIVGLPIRKLPLRVARALGRTMWRLRRSEAPPGQIEFARWPWVASNEKLKSTLGWTPAHSSRETFEITMRAHGKLGDATLDDPGPLAQLGERQLDKLEVAGSRPARPTGRKQPARPAARGSGPGDVPSG